MSQDTLANRMRKLEISESDLREIFARSRGPGGQNVNKVSTAVTLRHLPTGISVTVQDSRSQAVNRRLARERLLEAIESVRERQRIPWNRDARKRAAQKITEATCAEKENSELKTQAGGAKEAANKDQARLTSPNQCLQCFASCFHQLAFFTNRRSGIALF